MTQDFCWCQHKFKNTLKKSFFLPVGLISRNLFTSVSGPKEIFSYFRANYFTEINKNLKNFRKSWQFKTPFPLQIVTVCWNTGLVSSVVSFTSWGESASLTFNGVTIKILQQVDVLLHWPVLQPIFSYWVG